MQADDIGEPQQFVETFHRLGIAVAQLVGHVEINDAHAHGLSQRRELTADAAIADNAQRLAAHLDGAGRRLVPAAVMGCDGAREDAAEQHDDLADDEFRHAAGVGKGRVEDRDAAPLCGVEIDLVRPHAEAAHRDEFFRPGKDRIGELRARADADDVGVADGLVQRVPIERRHQARRAGIAGTLDQLHGAVIDPLEEEDADLVLGEGKVIVMGVHVPKTPI